MSGYRKITSGTRIPAHGEKRIDEFFGNASTNTDTFSLARMSAPRGWTEPAQRPTFGELTIMLAGTLHAIVNGDDVELHAGETLYVEPGALVRYENRADEYAEYWAVCIPAFTPERAQRVDD